MPYAQLFTHEQLGTPHNNIQKDKDALSDVSIR